MNDFLSRRIERIVETNNLVDTNYKSSILPNDLDLSNINFTKSRGSVRLVNENVLTPFDTNIMVDEVLAFDYSK